MPARAAIVAITGRAVGDPGMDPNKKNVALSIYIKISIDYLVEILG